MISIGEFAFEIFVIVSFIIFNVLSSFGPVISLVGRLDRWNVVVLVPLCCLPYSRV